MGVWYISSDGVTWQTLAAAQIAAANATFRANGIDEFRFTVPGDFLAAELYAFGAPVVLKYDEAIRYRGRINTIPRQAVGQSESVSYGAVGGWWWLEQIVYAQTWQMLRSTDNQFISVPKPRIIIGQDDAGNRRTLAQEIEAVIDFAIAAGAPLIKGVIDAGPTAPYSEHTNMRCADVIRQCLRLMPDRQCYCDHSTTPYPTIHCRCIDNLPAAAIDIVDAVTESIDLTPRYDLQLPGIRITYEQTHTWDANDYEAHTLDAAGDTDDARCVDLLFELVGSQTSYMKQKIEVEEYPAAPFTDKAFWVGKFSFLDSIDTDDLTIDSVTRSGVEDYEKFLTKGSIQDWMSFIGFEDEVWVVKVSYIRRDGDGESLEKVESKELRLTLRSCNASTREYRKVASFSAAEPIPAGVADALYASWGRLQWDGSLSLAEQEATFQAGPWTRLNLLNGRVDWATMNAAVQEVSIDIAKGISQIRTGPSGLLEADALVSLFRACHARRYSYKASQRNDALCGGAESEGAYQLPREKPSEADPGECRQLRVSATVGEVKHTIQMDPAVVNHEDTDDSSARTIQPREMWIPQISSAGPEDQLVMRRRQVMASDAYHSDVLVGGLIRIKELADVLVSAGLANWDVLRWDAALGIWVNSPVPGAALDLSSARLGYSVAGGSITLRAGKLKLHGKAHISIAQSAAIPLGGTQYFYVHHVRSTASAAWAVAGAEPGVNTTDLDIVFYKFVNGAFSELHRSGGDLDFDLPT
ncbi:MAG: hypothetical protein R6X19_09050 [Kiritimatiellia bacterium]